MDNTQGNSEEALFGIEHALNMYATSFFVLPPEVLYDEKKLAQHADVSAHCHIYLIGHMPRIEFKKFEQIDRNLKITFIVKNEQKELILSLPEGFDLTSEDGEYYLKNKEGEKSWAADYDFLKLINKHVIPISFEVKYIGQAYGKDGSRNAIDRLLKHETLQKISIKGAPEGHRLSLLLLEVQPATRVITRITPFAQNNSTDETRITAGVDKLFETNEAERISLYEAALIRYFSPEFNKEFKNSFPSTNLKILTDCYEKDFSAVIAEISIDELGFQLCSEKVPPKHSHIAKFDLHKEEERKMFFFELES